MAFSPTPKQAHRAFSRSGAALWSVAGATLLLIGCQTGPRGPAPGPIEPPVVPIDGQQNMVAVIVPLTGGDGPVGTSISNAARLALADTGDKTLRITVYDSAGPGGAAAAAVRAIAEGNRLILGPLLAEDVRMRDMPGVFYPSRGNFSAAHTCNNWTSDQLDAAGLPNTPMIDGIAPLLALDLKLRARVDWKR